MSYLAAIVTVVFQDHNIVTLGNLFSLQRTAMSLVQNNALFPVIMGGEKFIISVKIALLHIGTHVIYLT